MLFDSVFGHAKKNINGATGVLARPSQPLT